MNRYHTLKMTVGSSEYLLKRDIRKDKIPIEIMLAFETGFKEGLALNDILLDKLREIRNKLDRLELVARIDGRGNPYVHAIGKIPSVEEIDLVIGLFEGKFYEEDNEEENI